MHARRALATGVHVQAAGPVEREHWRRTGVGPFDEVCSFPARVAVQAIAEQRVDDQGRCRRFRADRDADPARDAGLLRGDRCSTSRICPVLTAGTGSPDSSVNMAAQPFSTSAVAAVSDVPWPALPLADDRGWEAH